MVVVASLDELARRRRHVPGRYGNPDDERRTRRQLLHVKVLIAAGSLVTVLVGLPPTHGIQEHIDAIKAFTQQTGGKPVQITSHPIGFGSGEWTCVVGELEDGSRMVTVARWRDGAIADEYIWM